ncbi:Ribonuclease H-like protein, partial [Metarhizium hybridum]
MQPTPAASTLPPAASCGRDKGIKREPFSVVVAGGFLYRASIILSASSAEPRALALDRFVLFSDASLCRTDSEAWYPGTISPHPGSSSPPNLENHADRCLTSRKRHISCSPTPGGKTTPLLNSHQITGPRTPSGQMHHRGSATGHHQVYLKLNDAAGYGYAVHQSGRSLCQGAGRLGPAEVFDAEAQGAPDGREAALKLPQSATQRIVVCLDNIAAAACLRGKPFDSSQTVFLTFQALAKTHRKTEVRWIPGHTKIPGNEQADILAKTGCAQPEPADAVPTPAFLRKTARQRSKIAVQAWWDASAPDK